MNRTWYIIFLLFILSIANSCEEDNNIDKVKPVIDNSFSGAFPVNCDTLYFGESFELRMIFTDNVELGSYSINIHDNFDQHSHSTEITECNLDTAKYPINPFVLIKDYEIPDSLTEYETNLTISIPSIEENELYDEGDYHFFISLTDKEGWSAKKGLSIKMLHR